MKNLMSDICHNRGVILNFIALSYMTASIIPLINVIGKMQTILFYILIG